MALGSLIEGNGDTDVDVVSFLISLEVRELIDEDEVLLNPGYTNVGGLTAAGGDAQSDDIPLGLTPGEVTWGEGMVLRGDGGGYVCGEGTPAESGLALTDELAILSTSGVWLTVNVSLTGFGGGTCGGGGACSFHVISGCVSDGSF